MILTFGNLHMEAGSEAQRCPHRPECRASGCACSPGSQPEAAIARDWEGPLRRHPVVYGSHVGRYVHMYVCTYVCIHTHIYIYAHIYTHIYIYTCIHMLRSFIRTSGIRVRLWSQASRTVRTTEGTVASNHPESILRYARCIPQKLLPGKSGTIKEE